MLLAQSFNKMAIHASSQLVQCHRLGHRNCHELLQMMLLVSSPHHVSVVVHCDSNAPVKVNPVPVI